MAIRTLSLQEFDRFRSSRSRLARRLTAKAVEWFADDAGVVLGAITYDEHALDWACVVLARDLRGTFCALDRDIGLDDLDDARRLLVDTMARAMAIGKRASPRQPAA